MKKTIELDLRKRCILTEITRIYNQAVNDCFQAQVKTEIEETIALTKAVLEQVDLVGLRGEFPELAGGSRSRVRLECLGTGEMRLLIQGRVIHRQSLQG